MSELLSIGIDLGTTHTAMAVATTDLQDRITTDLGAMKADDFIAMLQKEILEKK